MGTLVSRCIDLHTFRHHRQYPCTPVGFTMLLTPNLSPSSLPLYCVEPNAKVRFIAKEHPACTNLRHLFVAIVSQAIASHRRSGVRGRNCPIVQGAEGTGVRTGTDFPTHRVGRVPGAKETGASRALPTCDSRGENHSGTVVKLISKPAKMPQTAMPTILVDKLIKTEGEVIKDCIGCVPVGVNGQTYFRAFLTASC